VRDVDLPLELVLCRCEEVTVGEVLELVDRGITDPNELKRLCRIGMGLCQGRTCGAALESLVVRYTGKKPTEVGFLAARPPVRPVPLVDLAKARDVDEAEFSDPH